MSATTVATRTDRLSAASLRTVIEPDTDLPWDQLGPGQVIADELLSTAGLGVAPPPGARLAPGPVPPAEPLPPAGLGSAPPPEQPPRLSREELASMLTAGVRF